MTIARLVPLVILAAFGFYLTQAVKLPLGTVAKPGAGFYPVAVAVFACVVALVAGARVFLSPPAVRPEAPSGGATDPARRRRVAGAVGALVAFCLTLPWIGYPIAAFGFVSVVLWGLGGRWQAALLTGALGSAGSYYLFGVLLDVPLPRGPW
ncbi:MAG TPA: tripartite tricarboxylate transporter TctB family protein [Methylomirabilota bacterium]|nr:tripartite tricarboxylate transporter TctB family protein [Methylomirabilota bacterium]